MNKIKTYNVSGIVNNININDNVETISVKKALELVLTKYNLQNLLKETKGIKKVKNQVFLRCLGECQLRHSDSRPAG